MKTDKENEPAEVPMEEGVVASAVEESVGTEVADNKGEVAAEGNAAETATDSGAVAEEETAMTRERLESLLADAEMRGYVRGRNEQIELAMDAPGLWRGAAADADGGEPQPVILANMRPSVWDS